MRHILLICLLLTTGNALAQETFEEHRAKLTKEFSGFKSAMMNDYKGFRDKVLQEYCDMLKQAWEKVDALSKTSLPVEQHIPPVIYSETESNKPEKEHLIETVVHPVIPQSQPIPAVPVEPLLDKKQQKHRFSFMGTSMEVRLYDRLPILTNSNNEGIALFWETLSDRKFDGLVEDCLILRDTHHLCDWGYLLMLRQLSQSIYNPNSNEAVLLMSYLYCRSGYKMRLALTENKQLKMLYACQHQIINKNYWNINGTLFYAMDFDGEDIYLCTASFPKEQALSLYISTAQLFAVRKSEERFLQSERYPEMGVSLVGNLNQIEFYSTYPISMVNQDACTRWAMYANTPMDEVSKENLYPALQKVISTCDQLEAANRLLNFVQTAFVYEYDEKLWGYDRAFFAEETLYYPYCDCEDRSILFSRLIRDFLKLDVVLVYYPGHLATAVHFVDNTPGDYIVVNGEKYIICDPTYIGAPIGYTMDGMDNSTCKVILLDD